MMRDMAEPIYHFAVAHDGGNGYMKDAVNGERFVIPSVLSRVLPGNEQSKIESSKEGLEGVLSTLMNRMDITTQSNGINMNGRYLVGTGATIASTAPITFNVASTEGKSESDVSIISLLGLLTYVALVKHIKSTHQLPNKLDIVVDKMATSLPIEEMKIKGVGQRFANRFMQHQHVVIVNSFMQPITANITFKKVDVRPEGVIGQQGLIGYTNSQKRGYRADDIFDEFKKEYKLAKFTGKDVMEIGNVLNIDVGDGTTEFSVLNGAAPVPQLNSSIFLGTGTVTEAAVEALHQAYPTIGKVTRQAFMEIATRGNDQESKAYRSFLDAQLALLEQPIEEKVKTIYARLNSQINLITISGGGATTLKQYFAPRLKQVVEGLSPFGAAPILWVPEKYTQTLNLDGLEFRLSYL